MATARTAGASAERPRERGSGHPTSAVWLVYAAVVAVVMVVYIVTPDASAQRAGYWIFGASAVGAVLLGVRLYRPERRASWLLFAAGLAMFTFADVTYTAPMHGHGQIPTYVSDILYLAGYPLLTLGMFRLVHREVAWRRAASMIDAAVIALGVGIPAWVFVIAGYARDDALPLADKAIAISYPVLDLVLLAALLRLVASRWVASPAFHMLVASVGVLVVTDAVYLVLLLHGAYSEGGLVDAGWIVSYLLWGAAALHPSMATLRATPEVEQTRSRWQLIALAVAALAAPVTLLVQDLRGAATEVALLSATAGVIFVLVLTRLALTGRALDDEHRRRAHDDHVFRALIEKSSDVVLLAGADRRLRYVSDGAREVFGSEAGDLLGRAFDAAVHEEDRVRAFDAYREVAEGHVGDAATIECRVRTAGGSWRTVEAVVTNRIDDADVGAVVVNLRDVTERRALEARVHRHMFYDALTGLANRALFLDRLENALERHGRDTGEIAVLFLDLDDFSTVNDSLGHPTGDRLLVAVAQRLSVALRPGDTIARIGGDEFAVLVEGGEMPGVAASVAQRMVEDLEAPFRLGDDLVSIRASIGLAVGHAIAQTPEDLLRDADLAMFMAKHNGKGRFEIYHPMMRSEVVTRFRLTSDLRRALDAREFEVFYQPLIDASSGALVGTEALVRWRHPVNGLLEPDAFIGVAESTGQVIAIGRQVLGDACRQARVWRRAGLTEDDFCMSVNISARQLADRDVVDDVLQTLSACDLEPGSLVLEVTESTIMEDRERAIERLETLRRAGVGIAIDDFGTGYSSLSYLADLPADVVKIDRSFVGRLSEGPDGAAVVRSIVELTRRLGMRTVAEGVETEKQRAILRRLHCDVLQGFLFSEPLDRAAMSAAITEHRGGLPWNRPVRPLVPTT